MGSVLVDVEGVVLVSLSDCVVDVIEDVEVFDPKFIVKVDV